MARKGPCTNTDVQSNNEASGKKRKRRCGERGRTMLKMVEKALESGIPIELKWDPVDKLPMGEFASKFSNWIGVVTRRRVSCTMASWDDVDDSTKQLILDDVTGAFTVIEERYDWCRKKMGELFRKWKCTLVSDYLYDETGAIEETAPSDVYPMITQDEWNVFVKIHTGNAFKTISEKNKKNVSNRKGVYRGSRGGYRLVGENIKKEYAKKGIQVDRVERHVLWKRAHQSVNGEMSDFDRQIASIIEALEKEAEEGEFVPKGREDILAKAIGKPEHPGRVRGVAQGIGITEYFGKGPKRPSLTELNKKVNDMEMKMGGLCKMQEIMLHFLQTGEKPSQDILDDLKKGISTSPHVSTTSESNLKSQSHAVQVTSEESLESQSRAVQVTSEESLESQTQAVQVTSEESLHDESPCEEQSQEEIYRTP